MNEQEIPLSEAKEGTWYRIELRGPKGSWMGEAQLVAKKTPPHHKYAGRPHIRTLIPGHTVRFMDQFPTNLHLISESMVATTSDRRTDA